MLHPFQSEEAAESFIWSDGKFLEVVHSEEKKELRIVFTDYCDKRFRFLFSSVAEVAIADAVYCVKADHSTASGKKQISFHDDDGIVLSFRYSSVARHEVA